MFNYLQACLKSAFIWTNFHDNKKAISDTTRTIKQLTTDLIAQKCGTDEKRLDGQDNLNKINRDRQFAEDTLRACLDEIKSQGEIFYKSQFPKRD